MVMKKTKRAWLAVLAVVVVSCGGSTNDSTTTIPSLGSTTLASSTTVVTQAPTDATTTTTESTTTSSESTTTSTTLAGQEIDFGPGEGDRLMVIGVRYDDTLNLRAGPGPGEPILAEIPPTSMDLVATGHTRRLPSSFWTEVEFDGTVGWVHMRYVGYEGNVTDDTSAVVAKLGEQRTATTMTDLGEAVAAIYVASDGPISDVVQVTEVAMGDLAEVTYDVIGLGDDAVRGVRIHVFAQDADGGFGLKSVEVTAICDRGLDADRACV